MGERLVVEYAKSGRSRCRRCQECIESGSVRVGEPGTAVIRGSQVDTLRYFHLHCFYPSSSSCSQLSGLSNLSPSDQAIVRKTLSSLPSLASASTCSTSSSSSSSSPKLRKNSSCIKTAKGNNEKSSTVEDPNEWDLPTVEASTRSLERNPHLGERFISKLLPFQKQSIAFAVYKCNGRVILADEMGLGKTVQGIGFALAFRDDWPALIVTPSSVKLNWADELEKWVPALEPGMVNMVKSRTYPGKLNAPVTIVTYGMFASNSPVAELITKQNFKVVILDESHYIKSFTAIRTKLLLPILRNAQRVALLSGTPALAKPIELWPQVSALRSDLFPKYGEFTSLFCNPRRLPWGMDYNGSSNLDLLHSKLRQFMVRRLKKNVLQQLPSKQRQLIRLDIPERNLKEVKELVKELGSVDLHSLLNSFSSDGGDADEQLCRDACKARREQRKLLNELYTKTGQVKVSATVDFLNTMLLGSEEKIIVFAHHISVLDQLQQELSRKKIKYMRIDGSTPVKDRHENVGKFQDADSGVRVALLGITSAGQGITLTAASTVVFVEMHWTPGVLIQGEDRAHRIGQKNSVNIYYLMAKGSLDDIIWPMVNRKLDTVGKALDGDKREGMRAAPSLSRAGTWSSSGTSSLEEETIDSEEKDNEQKKDFPMGDMRLWLASASLKKTCSSSSHPSGSLSRPSTASSFGWQESQQINTVAEVAQNEVLDLTDSRQSFPEQSQQSQQLKKEEEMTPHQTHKSCSRPKKRTGLDLTLDDSEDDLDLDLEHEKEREMKVILAPRRGESTSLAKRPRATKSVDLLLKHNKKRVSAREPVHLDLAEEDIEDFDDDNQGSTATNTNATEKKKKEKPNLFFRASENTGRIFLYDRDRKPLHINFSPDDALETLFPNHPTTDGAAHGVQGEGSKLPLEYKQVVEVFIRQWLRLRAVERKELCGEIIQPPLLHALQVKRLSQSSPSSLCFDRFINPATSKGHSETGEVVRCLECGDTVPASLVAAGVYSCCSLECYAKYKLKTNSSSIRRQLYELERGVCQLCRFDAHTCYENLKHLSPPERYQYMLASKFKGNKKIIENPVEGDFWQADHIQAVSLGGGLCGLENFRTLCTPCHEKETRKLHAILRSHKLKQQAGNSGDIRSFMSAKSKQTHIIVD